MIFYTYCYFIFPDYISILQTSLNEFEFNLLYKRQPLIIEDKIKDVINILNAWFSQNIIKDQKYDVNIIWNKNKYKYIYCYAILDCEILLCNPKNKIINDTPDINEPIIEIKLKQNQSLIIPYYWNYSVKNNNNIQLYGIHDYITYCLEYII